MSQTPVVPVIMCGGAGSRLWPVSRGDWPKQFHAMASGQTLLAETLSRVTGHTANVVFDPYVILSSARHVARVQTHVTDPAACSALIYEPCVRSTGPAVAVATVHIARTNPNAAVLMLASDAHIADVGAFHGAVAKGLMAAADGGLITFGIIPDRPETGYGYIRRGAAVGPAFEVEAFVEKPDLAAAQQYLAEGGYDWNAGIFLFRPQEMLAELERQCPVLLGQATEAYDTAVRDGTSIFLADEPFAACDTVSIDYAVMEHAANRKVVPVDMGWNDIGSWGQVYDVAAVQGGDGNGNVFLGDVLTVDASGNYVKADRGLVGLVGVSNLAVLQTEDATVVVHRGQAQDVKKLVDALKAADRPEPGISASPTRIVRPAAKRVGEMRRWLFETALPFWADVGLDHHNGGVIETLDLSGAPQTHVDKRLRVLARQIYVFAHARLMGFDLEASDGFLNSALDHLFAAGRHPDGGWIHLFHPDGKVKDATRDTYDQAFVIFALAWAYRATGRHDCRTGIDETLAFLDAELADSTHGGYREALPPVMPRRANPHMHLLEAMLACRAATSEEKYLERAGALVALLDDKLLDRETWTLTEFFNDDWSIASGPAGQVAEPGHHYEWVWLLARYASAQPTADVSVMQRRLFAFAEAFGRDHATGRVFDEVAKNGRPLRTTSRTWPQTECLKCLLALRQAGQPGLDRRIDETLAVLMDDYLSVMPAGGWMDQFAIDGTPLSTTIPASTLYHVFSAGAELIRAFDDPDVPAI